MKIKSKLAILLAVLLVVPAYGAERVQLKFKNDADVFAALKPIRALKKDQYETSVDFTKRVCAATYKVLGVDDQTPVTLGTNFGEGTISITYDADKQAFVVQLGVAPHPILDDNAPSEDRLMLEPDISNLTDWSVLLATRPVKVLSTYVGENAFGVKRKITAILQRSAVLYVDPEHMETILSVKPEEARKLNGDLRLAIATRIQSPCFVVGHAHKSPSLKYPYDVTMDEMGFMGEHHSEWILYRASTKEVLKRGRFGVLDTSAQ